MKRKPKSAPLSAEAKHIIAMAAEELGGVEKMVKWARSNSRNRGIFYSQIYPRLLPYTVAGEVHATNDDGGDAREALERALLKLIEQRKEDEAAGVVSVAQAQENPGVLDDVPFISPSTARAPVDKGNVGRLHAAAPAEARPTTLEVLTPEQARQRAIQPLPKPPSNDLSTTELFYQHGGGGFWANLPGKI